MKMSDKVYNILKWAVIIAIPALTVAYVGLAKIWNFPYPDKIAETSAIICTLLGALLGFSSAEYYKNEAEAE